MNLTSPVKKKGRVRRKSKMMDDDVKVSLHDLTDKEKDRSMQMEVLAMVV